MTFWGNKLSRKKKIITILFVVLIFIMQHSFAAEDTFKESLNSTTIGVGNIGEGIFPFSLSWLKTKDITILSEEEYDKAHLQFSFSSSMSTDRDYGYDKSTGTPSWLKNTVSVWEDNSYRYYFKPSASISASLSQKFEYWTVKGGISTKYSHLMENLISGVPGSNDYLYFVNNDGSLKFNDKDAIAAYPWLYGKRNNFTANVSITLSRPYIVEGLDGMNVSIGFEMGPWWLLNSISNGNRLSDYYKISGTASESVRIKDIQQSINIRWLNITASHSNTLSYTFGKVVPKEKLNSNRLKGVLSDTLSISFAGPQLYDSSTSVSASISLNNYLYFGQIANMKNSGFYYSYESNISLSGYLNLFGIVSFSVSGTRYLSPGLSTSNLWVASGEVYMSFNF